MRRFVVHAAALAASSVFVLSTFAADSQCLIIKSSSDKVVNPAPCTGRTRALIVSRERPATPPFVVSTPVSSRGSLADRRDPGPGYYGVSECTQARVYVRIRHAPGRTLSQRAVGLDPFQQIPAHLPRRYHQAQEHWLYAQGLVQRARLLMRVSGPAEPCCPEAACVDVCAETAGQLPATKLKSMPMPRATIKLLPAARYGGDQHV